MTERLIIRNFAGLDDIDIELGRINIFIGPQASGKSVCAKCLYWFKSFLPELMHTASLGLDKKTFEKGFKNRFNSYFPSIWQNEINSILRYESYNTFIQLENKKGNIILSYSKSFKEAAENTRNEIKKLQPRHGRLASFWQVPLFEESIEEKLRIEQIQETLSEEVGDMLHIKQLFVIAGRSFFAALKGSVLTFLANAPVVDPFLREFITRYERIRRYQPDRNTPNTKSLWQMANHILRGQLIIEGDEDYILTDKQKRIPIANASSGQQEVFSLILFLMSLMSDDDEIEPYNPCTIYIEEPEAHLFPESQRALTHFMSRIYHHSPFNLQYVVTTHSPYLLSSFNNLVYASQLSEQLKDQPKKLKELHKIIPFNQQLPLSDFRVYGLENGKAISLINQETGLLSADLLDSASDVTAEQFGALMALDPTMQA